MIEMPLLVIGIALVCYILIDKCDRIVSDIVDLR